MKENEYKDLENQGWDNMFQTLESEMPQKKKRRGLFWLFLLLGTVAMGGGYWYLKTADTSFKKHDSVSKPIAQNNDTKKDAFSTKSNKNTEGGNVNIKQESNLAKRDNDLKHLESTNYNQTNTVFKTTEAAEFGKQQKFPELGVHQELKNDGAVIRPLTLATTNNNAEIPTLPLPIVSAFQSPITQDSNLKIEPFPIIGRSPSVKIEKQKLQWGITAGTHTENGQKFDGYQAGVVLNKPLNKRWAMETGINFRLTNAINIDTTYYLAYAQNASASTTALPSSKVLLLDKFYYLEMPLSVQYHLNKHFAIATGGKLAYLLDQSTKTNGASVYFVNTGAGTGNGKNLLDQINAQSLGLNRWDASWISGFTYMPNRHIHLTLRYDLGLTNILTSNRWAAYNRYLGLNALYLF